MTRTVTKRQPRAFARSPFFRNLIPQDLFEDFFSELSENGNKMSNMMNVSMDVAETDRAFEVKIDLPGIDPDDVDIQIDNNTLFVRGQRSIESEEQDENKQFHRVERFSGSFARSVVLPQTVNEDETAAEFKDGVLNIVIPKCDEAKPRKITINR